MQKKEQPEYRRAGEVPWVLTAGEILAQNNPNNTLATTSIPATGEPRSITFVGETLCRFVNGTVLKKKEAERVQKVKIIRDLEDELQE